MIQTDANKETLKQIKERERKAKEKELNEKCRALVNEKFGEDFITQLSNKSKGLWFMPVVDENDNIETLAVLKPIDRHILSYASTKIEDEGLYLFLEQCMRECFLLSVEPDGSTRDKADNVCILDDDDYFIPSAMKFNKIMEGKKVAFLKR